MFMNENLCMSQSQGGKTANLERGLFLPMNLRIICVCLYKRLLRIEDYLYLRLFVQRLYCVFFCFSHFGSYFLLERGCGQEGLEYIFDQIYRHKYNGFLLKGVVQ